MKKLFLDARIIIEEPKILALNTEEYELFTTQEVIYEIRESGNNFNISYSERLNLLDTAFQLGNLKIISTATDEISDIIFSLTSPRLDNIDKGILAFLLYEKSKGEIITLITKDKFLRKFATNLKLEVLSIDELSKILNDVNENENENHEIYNQIEDYERKETRKIFLGFVAGIILSMVAYLIYTNIHLITSSIDIWVAISSIIALSFILYIIREKWRLPYGFLEFSVGVFSVVIVFSPSNFNLSAISIDSTFFIKIVGGLYIMVRGIDNIMISIQDTRFGLFVRRVFVLDKITRS